MQLGEYVANHYKNHGEEVSAYDVEKGHIFYPNNFTIIKEDGDYKLVSFFVKVDDMTLEEITSGKIKRTDPEDLSKLLSEEGDNVHYLYIASDGMRYILKGIKEAIDTLNPRTVSWFNHHDKFTKVSRRRILCQQQ